jgi:8-oxo-dGTP pyrophosphatase MutT (NUDIX family)
MGDTSLRNAATVIVLRDDPAGGPFQVLMLRRHKRSGFAADAWVFPGGVVDPEDAALPVQRWTGIDPEALAARFKLDGAAVLAFHVAAIRETFEEAGLLLARRGDGTTPDLVDPALLALRRAMADRSSDVSFNAWLDEHDLILDLGALTYLSHWVTPTAESRRYDARFFLARLPSTQVAGHDHLEITDQRWVNPAAALEALHADQMPMIFPTIKTLQELAPHASVQAVIDAALNQPSIRRIQPHAELDENGRFVRVLHPDDEDFPSHRYPEPA